MFCGALTNDRLGACAPALAAFERERDAAVARLERNLRRRSHPLSSESPASPSDVGSVVRDRRSRSAEIHPEALALFRSHLFRRAVMRESGPPIGDRLVSGLDLKLEPKAAAVRRVEVITGGVSRRRWSEDEKARAVEASLVPDAVVSAVARRHGVTPQQLFTWRREARRKAEQSAVGETFVPVVVEATTPGGSLLREATQPLAARSHSIELDVEGSRVFIWPGAEPRMVTAIIDALKAVK
jgi:transposase